MSPENEDRNWLALQYVLGELSESDRIAFEERLPTDLQLCEAVTSASRLVLTAQAALEADRVALAPASAIRPANSSWLAVTVTSVATAFVLAVMVGVSTQSHNSVAVHNPQAAELVSLWRSGTDAGDDVSDDVDDALDGADDMAVPNWMLAAVEIAAGDSINGPSDKVQEN